MRWKSMSYLAFLMAFIVSLGTWTGAQAAEEEVCDPQPVIMCTSAYYDFMRLLTDGNCSTVVTEGESSWTFNSWPLLYCTQVPATLNYDDYFSTVSSTIELRDEHPSLSLMSDGECFEVYAACQGGAYGVTVMYTHADGSMSYVGQPGDCPVQISGAIALKFDGEARELYVDEGFRTQVYRVDDPLGSQHARTLLPDQADTQSDRVATDQFAEVVSTR